jgi:hypothetical protein
VPVSDTDQALMKLIDRIHTDQPFWGSRRIVDALADHGQLVNRKRVSRLMKLVGIQTIQRCCYSNNHNLFRSCLKGFVVLCVTLLYEK